MKIKLKWMVVLCIVMGFVSCQEERHESFVSDQVLHKSSVLTQKLHRVALALAAGNDVLDSATCFKIKLPVQATINGHALWIDDEQDYQQAAALLALPGEHPDPVSFQYPITLIWENGSETTVTGAAQFRQLQQQCPADSSMIPIQCVDFDFPFSISMYDAVSQTPQILTIADAFGLVAFFNNLKPAAFFQLNYPISVARNDGFFQSVETNAALQQFIDNFGDQCSSCDNVGVLIDNDLVFYMPFANEVADLTGFSTPVVPGANVSFVTDRSGNANGAFSFQTANGNTIQINATPQNNLLQAGAFTISLWFNRQNPQVFDFEQLFSTAELGMSLGNPFNQEIRSPSVWASGMVNPLYDTGWIDGGMLGELNQWHHMVVTYSGNTMLLYRDGVLQGSAAAVAFSGEMLGGGIFGNNFKGFIDDIRMYKRALSAQEIAVLFGLDGDVNTCME